MFFMIAAFFRVVPWIPWLFPCISCLLSIPYYVTHVVGARLQATDAIATVPVRRHDGS
jgi:hypothetical protein